MQKNVAAGMHAKAQSAMEYLVTYGWAFLIIGIVVIGLFALGVFSPSVPNLCAFPVEFSCLSLVINSTGGAMINIEQSTGSEINITAIGCNTNDTTANIIHLSPQVTIQIGGNASIGAPAYTLQCFSGRGDFTGVIGTSFHGYIILNYTDLQTNFATTAIGEVTQKIEN